MVHNIDSIVSCIQSLEKVSVLKVGKEYFWNWIM